MEGIDPVVRPWQPSLDWRESCVLSLDGHQKGPSGHVAALCVVCKWKGIEMRRHIVVATKAKVVGMV